MTMTMNDTNITLGQELTQVQTPHSSKTTFKFSPPWARCIVKCPGGGDFEASI